MYRFLLGLLLAIVLTAGCVTLDSANIGGSDGPTGPSMPASQVEIFPSQFEATNGATMVATVRATIAGQPVSPFDYDAVIGRNQDVATILEKGREVIVMKAENPGDAELIVTARSGGGRAVAQIKVVKASE